MTTSWRLAVARDALDEAVLRDADVPDPADGEAVLRVGRVGMTANNVTYAVLGESFRYWDFFPAEPGWGHVPLWGFAEVAASRALGVAEGQRVYGYLPPAGHLLVRPDRAGPQGFRDASAHRATLPPTYNGYAATTGDPAYEPHREDLQVLYRPLFFTSFVLADWLADTGFQGADAVVVSSASSKTAYGTAFLLRGQRPLVGLTSPGNVAFTESLGVYDEVLPYDAVPGLPRRRTAYVDLSGSAPVRAALRERLGADLVADVAVGITQQDPAAVVAPDGARPAGMFFAPDQIRKRAGDWGRDGLAARFGAAWLSFAPAVEAWVDVVEHRGPEALRQVWLDTLAGRVDPREGHVVAF